MKIREAEFNALHSMIGGQSDNDIQEFISFRRYKGNRWEVVTVKLQMSSSLNFWAEGNFK